MISLTAICFQLAHNLLGLGEVGELEVQIFNLALLPPFCQTLVGSSTFLIYYFNS